MLLDRPSVRHEERPFTMTANSIDRSRSDAETIRRHTRGFTLVELLVVVTLIGLLALMALPRFSRTRDKAYRAQMQTSLRTLVSAQEAYFTDNAAYTSNLANLTYDPTPMVTLSIEEVTGNGWSAKATHSKTPIECGLYLGAVSPVAGVPDNGNGVISCTAS
jgi:type IV pilus assembly protein PilA